MRTFYEILKDYRDKNHDSLNFNYTNDVLNQLLVISFNNTDKPDELPNVFTLKNIHFSTSDIENLMMDIGFEVEAEMTFRGFPDRLATFTITMKQK